jgi:hypothetical protein
MEEERLQYLPHQDRSRRLLPVVRRVGFRGTSEHVPRDHQMTQKGPLRVGNVFFGRLFNAFNKLKAVANRKGLLPPRLNQHLWQLLVLGVETSD